MQSQDPGDLAATPREVPRLLAGAVIVVLLGLAMQAGADSPPVHESLGEAPSGSSAAVGRAAHEGSTPVGGALHQDDLSLEDAGHAQATPVGRAAHERAIAFGEAPKAPQQSVGQHEAVQGAAKVPGCDEVEIGPIAHPAGEAAWVATLIEARRDLEGARRELRSAEAHYGNLRTHHSGAGAVMHDAIQRQNSARVAYARASCLLPELLEGARRAGVPPEILTRYESALPASL